MHSILLALTLTVYLLSPTKFIARLWALGCGPTKAPAATTFEKAGPGLDPFGATAKASLTEAGPGLDPDGHS